LSSEAIEDAELVQLLKAVPILGNLEDQELSTMAAAAESRFYDFGDTVYNTGDPGDGFYYIKSGAVRVFTDEHGKEISMGVRKEGEIFAEMSLLRAVPHESSVRASARTELVFVPRSAFAPILEQNNSARAFITKYVAMTSVGGFVSRLFNLRGKVDREEIDQLISSTGIKRVRAGSAVLEQGSGADRRLYVIRQGTVSVSREESGSEYPLGRLGPGEVLGEKACLLRQEQPATAMAETDVVLLVIPDGTVNQLLERNPKVRDALMERIQFADRDLERQKALAESRRKPVLLDLWSRPTHGAKLLKRFQLVQQAEEMDCGAACLAMICRHYGIGLTLGKLREMANVTTEGATMESLARVGESLGFTTRGMRCTYEALLGFDLPFIAHWEGYHFVVVYGVSRTNVWVADPAVGFRKMSVEDFERGWTGTCLLFTAGELASIEAPKSPWVRFVGYLRPYKTVLAQLFLATFVIQMLGVVPPVIIQNILDQVIVHHNVPLLTLLVSGLIITNVFSNLTGVMRSFLSSFMIRNMDFSMMSGFLRHAMSLPMSFFATRKTGDVFARFQENQKIRAFLTQSTLSTILNLLMVSIYLTILFLYSALMTSLLLVLVVPIIVLTVAVTPKLKGFAREVFAASTQVESTLMEIIGGVETVKGMGIERSMRLKWEREYAEALNVQYRSQRFNIWVGLTNQIFNATITITILTVGANLVMAQELSIGQLIAFNALMGSVLGPLMGLVGLWNQINEAGVAMERLGDVLDIEPEQKPETIGSRVVLPDLHGDIAVENLYFRYTDTSPYVLENINLHIQPGQLVSIVGQSGSGKTTLAKLLVGFYKPGDGRILIDGYDLETVDKEYYRAQIGYVMQSNLLFSGTIASNIASGDENPDHQRIVDAAKLADAHDFITGLPLGYEQVVGERGMGLSGGQMQRLCIARALYHDPKLLIFDEATSALDTQSESNILQNMQQILEGRTAVVIAHRLSTIVNSDKILVMYNGTIVEEGKHAELVDRKGMYFQLVRKQMASN
jgi:subfamily B ATP-binding cassette protein HlyB/CyaB